MIDKLKSSFLDVVQGTWPILAVVISFSFWFGGVVTSRMESPQEKQARIDRAIVPLRLQLNSLATELASHQSIAGHHVMAERVSFIQRQITETQTAMDNLEREFTRDFVRKDELSGANGKN